MASAAYTLTPYRAWSRLHGTTSLQTDSMLKTIDTLASGDDHMAVREPEHLHLRNWPDRTTFKANYAQWLEDSLFDSLPDRMRRHESYHAIVAQGDRVIPLIAAELRKNPSFLFLALEDITEEDPVPEEALGDLRATTAAWLTWLQR